MTADLRGSIIRLCCATAPLPSAPVGVAVAVAEGRRAPAFQEAAKGALQTHSGMGALAVNIDRTTEEDVQQCQT